MALQTANQFQLVPDIAGSLAGGVQAGQQLRSQFTQQGETEAQLGRQDQFRQLSGVVNDPNAAPEQRLAAQQQMAALDPERESKLVRDHISNMSAREQQTLNSVVIGSARLNTIPTVEGKIQFLENRRAELLRDGISNTESTDRVLGMLKAGDEAGTQKLIDDTITLGQQAGILTGGAGSGGGLASAKTEILDSGATIKVLPNGETEVTNPAGDVVTGQARLDVLKDSRQQGLATFQQEKDIAAEAAGKAESSKLKAQLKFKPTIEKAVTEARAAAANRGEAFTELSQAKASLPGLTTAVNDLKELALVATSTFGGRVFDTAVKESGFGATKGATARAKFIAIVNNQVLPLLKQTFGGSFSVQEGQELKASMGDPDASPQEKMAQLDAFIAQKVRTIEAKQAVLDQPQQAAQAPAQPAAQASQDQEAVNWARSNPNDPRSAAILRQNGVQ